MSNDQICRLTTKDYTILEVMQERHLGRDDPIAVILRNKLSTAVVTFREDIPANVVTLSSRVAYRVDDAPAETRIIAHDEMRGLVGSVLSITNPRGLALLGLAEGQRITISRTDGVTETLAVEAVVYQPEAAKREAALLGRGPATGPSQRPALRVVHRSAEMPAHPVKARIGTGANGFDDPGPSAA